MVKQPIHGEEKMNGNSRKVEMFLVGLISETELKAMAERGTRFEIQPAAVLLWNFGTKSYTQRWTR